MPVPSYPASIDVQQLTAVPDTSVRIPGSKSLTNRALILAALADGVSRLEGALFSEDTEVMAESLRRLGIPVTEHPDANAFTVEGAGGRIPAEKAELFLANSGTSIRFLTALASFGKGTYRLDGVERMRERPQADLLAALRSLGVDAASVDGNGRPPLLVRGTGDLPGGTATVGADASSQFLTALLMAAPYARTDVTLRITGKLRPLYVEITRRMMAQWSVEVETDSATFYRVRAGRRYAPQPVYAIEPDASSASYFFAAAAVTGGRVTVPGLNADSLQGDVRFATEVLAEMGCVVSSSTEGLTVQGPPPGELRGVDRDMSAISDTSLTLAAIAPFAASPTRVRNIAHARLQECDRISAVCTELSRLGVHVEERPDGFTIYPTKSLLPASIETYGDHRVAMSFALVGLKSPGVTILNPGCVAKTFPNYWQALRQLAKPTQSME